MIITIDGPAGSGKSSLSKKVAKQLNFEFLDTGAMYRALAYILKEKNIALDSAELEAFLDHFTIVFQDGRIFADGSDVTDFIRTPEIDVLTSSQVSVNGLVREKMSDLQRKAAHGKNIIAEGRDMGSAVFPDADLKIYLDARVDVRTERRLNELKEKGINKDRDELQQEIINRDFDDMNRKHSPLCVPDNAVILDTSDLTPEQVLKAVIDLYNKRP